MAIMVAGGLTFAIPGVEPAFAEVTKTNPHLYVSAEGQDAGNQFAQGNIIEVIVNDATIGDTDEGEAEPNVSINGADLRMLQTANGDWRAYFAQADALKDIDKLDGKSDGMFDGQLDYGVYCSGNSASTSASLELGDSNGVYFPATSGVICGTQSANNDTKGDNKGYHPLIRETRALTEPSTSGLGQLDLSDADLWPFIQVFDFAPESKVTIVYDRAGSQETVTLEFDDPSESHSLDRAKYPQGAEVLVTIEDYALNIDPTDEDTWAFDTVNKKAYYNLFDEDGDPLNINKTDAIMDYAGKAGIGEQLKIVRNGQDGEPLINCQVTKDFGMNSNAGDNAAMDYLVVKDKKSMDDGACTFQGNLNTPSPNAADIFDKANFVIGFVEDGSNNNQFINWAENQKSNLVVRDDAQRNRSFEIDYNAPGAISGLVGHFTADLALGDSGATWNSGERIGITLTDEDANTNPLAENDLTVANPDSRLVPSIRIGEPITLASVNGSVTWYNIPAPLGADTVPPVIAIKAGTDRIHVGDTFTDAGATCTDDRDDNLNVTTTGTVNENAVGDYTLTYTCTDSSDNTASENRIVNVVAMPDPPTGVEATPGNMQVTLSWVTPANTGGDVITGYNVEYKPASHSDWTAHAGNPIDGLNATVTGLTNGQVYNFRMSAVNLVGNSTFTQVDVTPSPTVPGAPQNLRVMPSDRQVELTWDAPVSNGGEAITDYRVEHSTDGVSWTADSDTSTTTGATVSDLTNGDAYQFRVSAINSVGTGDASDVVGATPGSSATAPGAPTGLMATPSHEQVILSWTAPTNNGGAPISHYEVQHRSNGGQWTSPIIVAGTTATVQNLQNGQPYDFQVSAVNSAGTGSPVTASATPTAAPTAPGVPTGLTATADNAQVVLSWTAPASDGGSPIRDYAIEQNHNGGGWTTINDGVSTATSYTVTGLTNGDSYEFRVSAINSVGTGTESNVATATPTAAPTAPGVPTGLTATAGNAQVVLSWTAPASDGGSPITDYAIEQNHNGGGWTTINDGVSTATSYTVTGLTNGDSYEFRVSAINSVGTGTESNVDDATPTAPRPLVLDDFGAVSWVNGTDGVHRITIPITGQIDVTPANASVSQSYDSPTHLRQKTIELWINPNDQNSFADFQFANDTTRDDSFDTTDLAVTSDGKITATVTLHSNNGHSALAGTTANFTLWVENVTNAFMGGDNDRVFVFSNVISKMIPPIPTRDTNVVDMTTTPISGNAAGFPPITRAVISNVAEIPAIHNVALEKRITIPTDEYKYEFEASVEDFSDRLRLAAPTGDAMSMDITGDSAVVISDWKKPEFASGVTTLFNWNVKSLADHAKVTGVYLANDTHKVLLSTDSDGLIDLADPDADKRDDIEKLTGQIDLIITLNGKVDHLCDDITLVADFFTIGDGMNNAIYRIEVEEATPNSADFEATIEYTMLNQLNIDKVGADDLRAINSDVLIVLDEDYTDETAIRVNYLDLGADGVSTQIAIQQDAPTHSGVVSFDAESYKIADTVTITVDDADLNVDNDVVDIYTVQPPSNNTTANGDRIGAPVSVGDDPKDRLLLEVTFNDEAWVHSSPEAIGNPAIDAHCHGEDVSDFTNNGLADTGFTLVETASNSGIFRGDFQIPNMYCEETDRNNNKKFAESVTGVDIEVNYYDFRDASGNPVEVGDDAAVRANTGTVSLDRTVYPVPFDPAEFGTAEGTTENGGSLADLGVSGDLTVYIQVNDADFDVSAAGEDTMPADLLKVEIIRGAANQTLTITDTTITEIAPDAGVFELDLTIAYDDGPDADRNSNTINRIQQGDILQVQYTDPTDASGEKNTVTDSATFDLRNGVLQSDKSVYIIGSDMILTLIEPDLDLDNDGAETYPLDLIEWDSDADTLGMGCEKEGDDACKADKFDPEPAGLRETGDSTGIFQSIIEIPAELGGDRLERGEEIELEYVDHGPSGSDFVGDETEDITLTVFTSNFGATIELDQKVYTWTDKVYITIVAPDHNFDSALVDEIGESDDDPIRVSTRSDDLDNYKLVETGPDTGIFTGEVILIGFDHNADGNTQTGTPTTGYDNPQRSTGGSGPTNGFISTDDDSGITVSFEFSEDETVTSTALIRWNIGEVQWLEASYPASGTGVVRVIDPDMNWSPEAVDNFEVDVWSDEDSGGIDLTVTETNQATGIFEGTVVFTISDESSGHRLRVAEGDTVTAEYEDNTLPDPYTTADELDVTATTLIGTIVPPLERAPASNLRIVDAFENSLDTVSVDQQVQIVADLTNGQDRTQEFAYLVQVQDANGVTVSLAWITGTLEPAQTLSPSASWIPTTSGEYTATAFVWESVDNPTALSPPVTTTITVS